MKVSRFAALLLMLSVLVGSTACATQSNTQTPSSVPADVTVTAPSDISPVVSGSSAGSSSSGQKGTVSQPNGNSSAGKVAAPSDSPAATSASSSKGPTSAGNSTRPSSTGKPGAASSAKASPATGTNTPAAPQHTAPITPAQPAPSKTAPSAAPSKATPSKPASTPTSKPSNPTSTKPSTPSKPKTAYDKPYDIDQIRADMIAYGKSKGMYLKTSLWVKNEPPMYPSNCGYFPPTNTYEDIDTAQHFREDCNDSIDYIIKSFQYTEPNTKTSDIGFNVVCLPLANHPGDYFIFVLYG